MLETTDPDQILLSNHADPDPQQFKQRKAGNNDLDGKAGEVNARADHPLIVVGVHAHAVSLHSLSQGYFIIFMRTL